MLEKPLPPLLPAVLLLLLVGAGCRAVEEVVMERFRGETPHERYLERLERADLGETALARDWALAAREALEVPIHASVPMRETGWLPPEIPTALGYRFELQRGQRLRVSLEMDDDHGDTQVFMEVFRVRGDVDANGAPLLTVGWTEVLERELVYDASTSATYLVRVQPELLRGGAYQLSLAVGPSLAFPVDGAGVRDVGSFFGADRDGGARQHHGVDIFAPRGTPVLAASPGRVRRVRTTPIGGHVVWVRNEERGHSEYYAHLDTQLVENGQWVEVGDTLGLVGNSGNAVTTPPHLHFGIYARGPVDPLPYLADPGRSAPALAVEPKLFHTRTRLTARAAEVHVGPWEGSETLTVDGLDDDLDVRVLAGSGSWLRVRLADGRHGYVRADRIREVEALARPFERVEVRTADAS